MGTPVVAMAGNLFALQSPSAVELHSAIDGHLVVSLPFTPAAGALPPYGVASDGSYGWLGTTTSLEAWSSAGVQLFSRAGSYASPSGTVTAFATPTQIMIGRASTQTIEYVAVSGGSSTTSPAFAGTFASWFLDGSSFFTTVGTNVRVYTPSAAQQVLLTLSSTTGLAGTGGYFWSNLSGIYRVAMPGGAPYPFPNLGLPQASGNRIALIPQGTAQMGLIHLDPTAIMLETITLPAAYPGAFGADTSGSWAIGNHNGVVYDSINLPAGKGALSCGRPFAVAGADTGLAAVGTDGGGVLVFGGGSSGVTFQGTIPHKASRVQLSADGTTVVAYYAADVQYWPDQSIRAFSLPTGALIHEWPNMVVSENYVFEIALARGGSQLGQITGIFNGGGWAYTRTVSDLMGTTTSFSNPINGNATAPAIFVSPDGTLVAAADTTVTNTQIYKNGALVDAVAGAPAGWLDDDRLIVGGTAIHSVSSATNVASITLPCTLVGFGVVDATHVYCPSTTAIYDLTTSAAVWTGSAPAFPIGANAGAYVVYPLGHHIQVDAYSL